jgi:hypothetical protein
VISEEEKFEDAKGVIRSRKSKDRKNEKKKKDKHTTWKTINLATRNDVHVSESIEITRFL